MTKYKVTNTSDAETHYFTAETDYDARHWVINHLDMSKEWTYEKVNKKTIGVDFDGTLCKKQEYGDGLIYEVPNENAVETIKKLSKDYNISIFTVRLNPIFGGDIDWKKQQIADWCEKYNVPYNEITNNKPEAVAYIDDRAIRFTNWTDIGNYFLQ